MSTAPVSAFRAIAVLMVLAYHTEMFSGVYPSQPWVATFARTGYVGVDLFFIISGFVLFLPHARYALAGGPKPDSWMFAIGRAAKIVPSYFICLCVVAVLSLAYLGPGEMLANLTTHAFFIQNNYVDGFGPVISVFWSLAIEVQFYFVFPLIASVFRREPILTAGFLAMTALAYRYAEAPCCVANEQIMRQLPSYLDLFAAGMLAAYAVIWVERRGKNRVPLLFSCCTIFGMILVVVEVSTANGTPQWFVDNRLLFAIVTGQMLLTSCLVGSTFRKVLANPLLLFLSTISYNVYLWHTVFLIWFRNHGIIGWLNIAYGWGLTLIVSIVVTFLIERPIIRLAKGWSIVEPSRQVSAW